MFNSMTKRWRILFHPKYCSRHQQLGHKWINISIDFLSPQRVIDWNQRHIITRDSWVKPGDTVCFITEQAISIISRTQKKDSNSQSPAAVCKDKMSWGLLSICLIKVFNYREKPW